MLEYILFPEKKKKSKLNPTPRYIKFLSFSAVILASIVAGSSMQSQKETLHPNYLFK